MVRLYFFYCKYLLQNLFIGTWYRHLVFLLFSCCFWHDFQFTEYLFSYQSVQYMGSMKKSKPKRLDITSKDVIQIHNCSERTAIRKMEVLKDALAKQPHMVITIEEYCNYYGFDYYTVLLHLDLLS